MTGLSIGKLAVRTGLSVSAIRFYEDKGLITPDRNPGGQRRFARSDLRRLSFIMIMQRLGFSLIEIRTLMSSLPDNRPPNKKDWTRISRKIRQRIDVEIAQLEQTRQNLDGCIGCGCLSLKTCALYNPEDKIARKGAGPRYTMGDTASDVSF